MSCLLTVRHLGKGYVDGTVRRPVLEDLSFQLDAGEILAVCGPSGSGKSTLLNLLAGMLAPDEGTVRLCATDVDVDLAAQNEQARTLVRRRYLGYVFQFFNLVPTLTVRENVLLPLELTGRQHLRSAALARLEALGLQARADAYPENLSGGERQRTAIARAMAHEPFLLLADEPTGNLDHQASAAVAELLWREARTQSCGMIVATHNEEIAARADRVLRLDGSASSCAC